MNKKISVRNENGQIMYCVLSGEKDFEEQFNKWYYGNEHPHGGHCVTFTGTRFAITDYFHAEEVMGFDVLSVEDTDEELLAEWTVQETE